LWLQKNDEFILRYCSTSPKVEPPGFCDSMRATFRRMISDPRPLQSLFAGNAAREYSRDATTGQWTLDGGERESPACEEISKHNKEWGVKDFKMAFN